jgi:hypothetical protein
LQRRSPSTERRHGHPNVPAVDDSTWTLGLGLGPTTTPPPVAAGATQVCCYGCQRPGIHRKNCPTCNVTDSGTSALNGFCTLNVNPLVPRRSPTVSVSISDVQESAIVHTVACYSVASAGLDKHLLATGHPTQKVIVKATRADVWSAYQAQGSSDYIMQDAADAKNGLRDGIHLATLRLRPVEGASPPEIEKERLNALLDQHVELFAKTGPPTPFAQYRIDTGDSTLIASPQYRLTPGKRQTTQTEIHAMLEAFQTLKKQLTSTPVLRTADLPSHSSYVPIAARTLLAQPYSRGRRPRNAPSSTLAAFTSRRKGTAQPEKKKYWPMYGINKFRSYVKETSIVVIIDCRPLPWFIALKTKWLLLIYAPLR